MKKLFGGDKKREEHRQGFQSQLGGEAKKLPGASVAKHLEGTKKYGNVRGIPLDRIKARKQIREEFDETELNELAASLKEHGQQQPCKVFWSEADDAFILIAGERRFRAAKIASLEYLKCDVMKKEPSDAELHELQLVENVQRKDLSTLETARAYQKFVDDFGYTQSQIAKKTGKSQATISKALKLLKLPAEILDELQRLDAPKQLAESLVRMKSAEEQRAAIEAHERGEVTARDVQEAVSQKSGRTRRAAASKQQRVKKARGIGLKATGKKKHTNTDFALAALDWCEDLATNKRAAVDRGQIAERLHQVLVAIQSTSMEKAA